MNFLRVILILLFTVSFLSSVSAESGSYIIHVDSSAIPKVFSGHHTWYLSMLSSISDTASATSKLIYTYSNSIHGFSASLTSSELEALKNSFGYISSTRDLPLKLHTTHTSQFLGLSSNSDAWTAPNQGEDVIIGLVDTGIWPENESFNDEGMTEVPSKWKGNCESATKFNSSFCNKKLVGARFYNKGLLANNPRLKLSISTNSPRDSIGHGTHTSSIAAGNYAKGASFFGYAPGVARGMAPRARVAMYKAVWRYGVYASDVLAAMDQAIQDGVDVLSISLGLSLADTFVKDDPIAIAAFAAMEKGIFVAASAGNDGPFYWSLINGAPWMLTVGAGTVDREFGGTLTLGNGVQIGFKSLYPGNFSLNQMSLVFMDECTNSEELKELRNSVIVCKDNLNLRNQVETVRTAGVPGAVFISDSASSELFTRTSFPAAFVGLHDGQTAIDYIKESQSPTGSFQFQKTRVGTKPAPRVDSYSSRGPFLSCRNVLKPDILAPGTLVLASWSPTNAVAEVRSRRLFNNFNLVSGTSMAAPHAAGVAAILKRAHPDWSPAAIRSAMMTTANDLDNTFAPIKDVADYNRPASPLDIGAGHINPNKAIDPGLVYDATAKDYIKFLCAMKYTATEIRIITGSSNNCLNKSLDLNYPSFIAFFNDEKSTSQDQKVVREFRRVVTNVGEGEASYTAELTGLDGIKVTVEPWKLEFRKKQEKQSYRLSLEGPKWMEKEVVHGSLSWVDDEGKYVVRSPIVATMLRPEIP
ncbi:hypothetical protein SLEP1_g11878 [Rubroshorea leprosula]|nr:hypothetical protein SLEP1_g11878 [Rubroshorea leprosula]